jgi:cyclohexanecarboxyl-CoA dehydrogenase
VVGPGWTSSRRRGLCAIALTEPRGGSDAANLRLRVERVGDHYLLNGEKTSISAADQATLPWSSGAPARWSPAPMA